MTIRPIDRFVGAMHRDRAESLLLESGRPVRLRVKNSDRILLAQEVRTDQIENLVREITPPDCRQAIEDSGSSSFPYSAPTGPVVVNITKSNKSLTVLIQPYSATAAQAQPQTQSHAGSGGQPHGNIQVQAQAQAKKGAQTRANRFGDTSSSGEIAVAVESPLQGLMAASSHKMAVVAGAPTQTRGGTATTRDRGPADMTAGLQGSAKVQDDLRAFVESGGEGPVELLLESVAPPSQLIPQVQPAPMHAMPFRPPEAPVIAKAVHDVAVKVPFVAPAPQPPTPSPQHEPQAYVEAATPRRYGPIPGAPQLIDPILKKLVACGGSDLHLTADLSPKMRKDGDIQDVPGFSGILTSDTIAEWLLSIALPKAAERFDRTNDTDFAYEIPGIARFRVNVFKDRRGVGGVMRVIPSEILSADKLKLPQAVRDLCGLQKGLVVVTGPTGSGKSTTLAAMVDLINRERSDHIITIEDPVEFVHEPQSCLVNQREVHTHTESFSAALRAALREDPDIVLVGEMRDLETVSIAIETAETGHLVFGTLHTNTAISTVDRIIDQFPTDRQSQVRVMLSESLRGVIAQTLCKKIGGGRVAALEILLGVPAVANLIREGKTFQIASIMQTGKAAGMQALNDSLMGYVKDGVIEAKEAYKKSVARAEMRALLERAGHKLD